MGKLVVPVERSGLRAQLSQIGKESWLLFLAVTVANASNYIFHVSISRFLGPSDYGALGAVLGILTILSIPFSAIQAAVARRSARDRAESTKRFSERQESLGGTLGAALKLGLAISVALAALSPLATSYLHLESALIGLTMAVYVLPAILLAVGRGALQGELRFKELAIASVLPVLVRLGAGIPIVAAGGGVFGATAVTVLGDIGGVIFVLFVLARKGRLRLDFGTLVRPFVKEVAPVAFALLAMWVLIEVDLVMARHYLGRLEAGSYSAAGLLARAVLFLPGAVSLVALPHFSEDRGRGREAYRWLLISCVAVIGLGSAAALVLGLANDFFVATTFGADFQGAGDFLPVLSLAMVALGVANLVVFFHVAAESRVFHLLWIAVALEVAAIALFHESGQVISSIVLGISVPVAVIGFLTARSVALTPRARSMLPPELSVRAGRQVGVGVPDISVVVPCHNVGPLLTENVATIVRTLDRLKRTYEVIVVSDGSTDGAQLALAAADPNVSVVHYERRMGKGMALRIGMARTVGKYVAFIDADGELDSGDLHSFLAIMDLYSPDIVLGSKRHPLSTVKYPPARRAMSWVYQRLTRVLFGLNVRDTQTGLKVMRRDVLEAVLPRTFEKRFALDLELLVVAKKLGFERFFEAPIRLDYKFESTVSARAVFHILQDTAAIFYRRYILRSYDGPPSGGSNTVVLEELTHIPTVALIERNVG